MTKHNLVTLDFETYYDARYSLTNHSYTEYIYSKHFKVHGAAVKVGHNPAEWLTAYEIPAFLEQHKFDTFVFHNASFDAAILSLHYGFMPRRVIDTRLLAAILVGWHTKLDLATLAVYFDCPLRKGQALADSKGVRVLGDIEGLEERIAAYSCTDVEITYWLLWHMQASVAAYGVSPEVLRKELQIMSLTIRLIKPHSAWQESLHIDRALLEQSVEQEKADEGHKIRQMAARYQYPEAEFIKMLRSRKLFPAFMERLGIHLPQKVSKTTGKPTYALGKNDTALLALREQLAGTDAGQIFDLREGVGSTIKRTRSERILAMARAGDTRDTNGTNDAATIPPIPVFLNYAGAQKTLRWSGGNKVNMQNLPRGSVLRSALVPPPGYKMVVCDYSSIEARVLAWLACDEALLSVFRAGEDVYVNFGQHVWPSTMLDGSEEPEDSPAYKQFKKRRFVAKTCVLGLGYGASWPVLETVLRTGSMGASVIIDEETARGIGVERAYVLENLRAMKERYREDTENGAGRWEALVAPLTRDASLLWHYGACMRLVEIYRGERWAVTAFWQAMEPRRLMTHPVVGHIKAEFDDTAPMTMRLILPGGAPLVFPHIDIKRRGVDFVRAGVPMSTYGAKLVENVTQAVARNLLRDAWIEVHRVGLHVAMTVHDELVCIEREEDADRAAETLTRIMSTTPDWAVGLPIEAKASVVDCYAQK